MVFALTQVASTHEQLLFSRNQGLRERLALSLKQMCGLPSRHIPLLSKWFVYQYLRLPSSSSGYSTLKRNLSHSAFYIFLLKKPVRLFHGTLFKPWISFRHFLSLIVLFFSPVSMPDFFCDSKFPDVLLLLSLCHTIKKECRLNSDMVKEKDM